ncbi:hypothetical protein JCM10450v2_007928 [Rhodotorula kratochvilovae]
MPASDPDSPFLLTSPPPSPSPTPSPPSKSHRSGPSRPSSSSAPGSRKGRWTPAEHAELLAVGDAHGGGSPGAAWDEIRMQMRSEAKGRSTQALRARYALLVKERREREEGGTGGGEEEDDAIMFDSSPSAQMTVGGSVSGSSLSASSAQLVNRTFSAVDALLLPAPAPQPGPWTMAEDAALYAAMSTPPLGPVTWAQMHVLTQRIYFLAEDGATFARSEAETRARWEAQPALRAVLAQPNVPPLFTNAIISIHGRLSAVLQAALDALSPALAHSLRTGGLAPVPVPLPAPAPAPVAAPSSSGRAAPPFPARASPVLLPPAPTAAGEPFVLPPLSLALHSAHAPPPAMQLPPARAVIAAGGNGSAVAGAAGDASALRPFSLPAPMALAPVAPVVAASAAPAGAGGEGRKRDLGGDGGGGEEEEALVGEAKKLKLEEASQS